MDRRRRRAISCLGLLALPVLVSCGILGYWLFAGINITRNDYEQALGRWRSQGIADYEMVVEFYAFNPDSGEWTMRVTNGKVVTATRTGPGPNVLTDLDDLQFLTVEGSFTSVEYMLNDRSGEMLYTVAFDPGLGYPTSMSGHPKPWRRIYDADGERRIKRLTVIK
jgi:hypothetical protein